MSDRRWLDGDSRLGASAGPSRPLERLTSTTRYGLLRSKARQSAATAARPAHAATDAGCGGPAAAARVPDLHGANPSHSTRTDGAFAGASSKPRFEEQSSNLAFEAQEADDETPPRRSADESLRWRSALFFFDLACLALPLVAVLFATTSGGDQYTGLVVAAVMPVVGLGLLGLGDRRRGDIVPTSDLASLGIAVGMGLLAVLAADAVLGTPLGTPGILLAGLIALIALVVTRLAFAAWLGAARAQGRYQISALLVGTGEDAYKLWSQLGARPDSGYVVTAAVGDPDEAAIHDWDVALVGSVLDTVSAAKACGATVALVSPGALDIDQLNELVRQAPHQGLELQLWPGLDHVATRRLQATSVARTALVRVGGNEIPGWQLSAKRVIDVAGATLLLLASLPIFAVSAVAVRLSDGGPVLFRQKRVGKDGQIFNCLKLRTMTDGAHEHVEHLRHRNDRTGPLFKVDDDPRATGVGRVLRALSIDELPQLINVLVGDMSLVGPRPALPEETVRFDTELQRRHDVLPGITGLWQVEARDNPAFIAYRDLDLYYVDNWSLGLDLAVLFVTVPSVLGRGLRAVGRHIRGSEDQ